MANEIAKLRKEHVNFRKLLDLLEQQLDLFHFGGTPDYALMTDILHYMTQYPDRFHHPKEDLVFGRLAQCDSRVAQSVEGLARQHHVIAESGARMHDNLESVLSGAVMPKRMIEAPGLLYVTYYRNHMDQEENELFVMADKLLGEGDWKEINGEMRSQPDPMFGHEIEERYRAVYRHIVQSTAHAG